MQSVPDSLLGRLVTTENRTSGLENTARGTEKQEKERCNIPQGTNVSYIPAGNTREKIAKQKQGTKVTMARNSP